VTISSDAKDLTEIFILVADDDPIAQMVTTNILESAGYRTDSAKDGREAVEALELKDYDLVLMDCLMPNMDGFEATRIIRNSGSDLINSKIPVIALTGLEAKDERTRCLNAGMDHLLSKPVTPDKLITVVAQALGQPKPVLPTAQQDDSDAGSGLDDEFLGSIIEKFLAEVPGVVVELQQAVASEDVIKLRNIGHRMRGISNILEVSSLSARSRELEQAGDSENMELAGELAAKLIADLRKLEAALSA